MHMQFNDYQQRTAQRRGRWRSAVALLLGLVGFGLVSGVLPPLCGRAQAQPSDRPGLRSPYLRERSDTLERIISAGAAGLPQARAALAATDHRDRTLGLQALGHIGTPDDVALIRKHIPGSDRMTGILAAGSLARLVARGAVPAAAAFDGDVGGLAVTRIGISRLVEEIIFDIADRPTRVRWHHGRPYLPLCRLGRVAVPALQSLAADRLHFASDARAHTLIALGRIGAPGVNDFLIELVRGLADLDLARLEGEDLSLIRAGAIAGMCMIGEVDTTVFEVYRDAADRNDAFTRSYGAWGLFLTGSTAEPPLRAKVVETVRSGIYFDQNESVLEMLAFCLQAYGSADDADVIIERLREQPRHVDPFLLERLYWMGPETAAIRAELERQLASEHAASRLLAKHFLGKTIGEGDVRAVISLLEERPSWVAESTPFNARPALLALGVIGATAARDDVLRQSEIGDDQVRSSAALALGGIGGDGVIERLAAMADDRSDYVRFNAAQSLARLDDPRATIGYIDALETGNIYLTRLAIERLTALAGDDLGFRPDDPSDVRLTAAARWRQWWTENSDSVVCEGGALRLDKP